MTKDGIPIAAKSLISKDDFVFLQIAHMKTGKIMKPLVEISSTLRWSNSLIVIGLEIVPKFHKLKQELLLTLLLQPVTHNLFQLTQMPRATSIPAH
jgi:hypothetical protein